MAEKQGTPIPAPLYSAGAFDSPLHPEERIHPEQVRNLPENLAELEAKAAAKLDRAGGEMAGPLRVLPPAADNDAVPSRWVRERLPVVGSLLSALADPPPAVVAAFRVLGYATESDGGEAVWRYVGTEPAHGAKRQDANGRWLEIANDEVDIRALGAVCDGVTLDHDAINQAASTRRNVYFPPKVIAIGDTVTQYPNTRWRSRALGTYPTTQGNAAKNMSGAILLVAQRPTTEFRRPFMSDMRASGGVVPNHSSINSKDAFYSLTSFLNDDANETTGEGATMRPFTVGVHVLHGAQSWIENLRIMLSYDGRPTMDGLQARRNWQTNQIIDPVPNDLGPNSCDIGLLVDNNFSFMARNVQCVGYWRIAGCAVFNTRTNDVADPDYIEQGSEYCTFERCAFQGQVGFLDRGADRFAIIDVGVDWVEVPWAANHPFSRSQTLGRFRVITGSRPTVTYTGQAKIGDRLRLTGLNRDLRGVVTLLTSAISPSATSRAISNTVLRDCVSSGMSHVSGKRVTELPDGVRPSAMVELSGWLMRGISFDNCKFNGVDDVAMHLHDVVHLHILNDTAFESIPAASPGPAAAGMRFIASPPLNENTRVPYPSGVTSNLCILGAWNFAFCDMRPAIERVPGYQTQSRFSAPGDIGLFDPAFLVAPTIFGALSLGLNGRSGRDRGILDDAGNSVIYMTGVTKDLIFRSPQPDGNYRTAGRYTTALDVWTFNADEQRFNSADNSVEMLRLLKSGGIFGTSIRPKQNNALQLGNDGFAWQSAYISQVNLGGTSDPSVRAGTDEPSGSSPDGSLYLRSGATGRPYVSQSDGWKPVALLADLPIVPTTAEGSWTPTLLNIVPGDATFSYTTQNGYFHRIGNRVLVVCDLRGVVTHTTATGAWRIGGLPAVVKSGTGIGSPYALAIHNAAIQYPAGRSTLFVQANPGTSQVTLRTQGNQLAEADLPPVNLLSGVNFILKFSLEYVSV